MQTVADTISFADILGDIPHFSGCSRDVLSEFVSGGAFILHAGPGTELRPQNDASRNLYVLVTGSAVLDTDDDVHVTLEPGDYFGGQSGHLHTVNASVVAVEDVEVLVIGPEDLRRLQHASSRRHHPSNAEWIPEPATPNLQLVPRHRHAPELARSAS